MKTATFFRLALTAMTLTACSGNYMVATHMDADGKVQRSIYSADSSTFLSNADGWNGTKLVQPLAVDFYDAVDTMHYVFSWTGDTLCALHSDCAAGHPRESLSRRFLWFVTRYDYRLHFDAVEGLPVPISDYLSDEQVALLCRGGAMPDGWNGMESYQMLDRLNEQYARWSRALWYQIVYEAFLPYLDSRQLAAMQERHDTLIARCVEHDADGALQLAFFGRAADDIGGLEFLIPVYYANSEAMDKVFSDRLDSLTGMMGSVVYTIEMPGIKECSVKVDAVRLLAGDMDVDFHSYRINWWAWAITALVLAAAVFFLLRRRKY